MALGVDNGKKPPTPQISVILMPGHPVVTRAWRPKSMPC